MLFLSLSRHSIELGFEVVVMEPIDDIEKSKGESMECVA